MKKAFGLIRRLFYIAALVAFLVVWQILKKNPETCEKLMRGAVRTYGKASSFLSGLVPVISLTEALFVFLVLLFFVIMILVVSAFVKKEYFKGFGRFLIIPFVALSVIADYAFSCELAYNREEMPLPYYENEVSREDYVNVYNYFADDLNACISELEFEESGDLKAMPLTDIASEVKKAYEIVTDPYFHPYIGVVKGMLSSVVYREFQITGVTFNPLGEANINTLNTNVDIPLTVAHELAHTKGVMREDDANQLAFYVCLHSENPYLRYSAYAGYFYQLQSIASASYLTSEELSQCHKVEGQYNKTTSYVVSYWKKHQLLTKISDFINDMYIKSSGVEEGTKSYAGGTEYEFDPTTNKLIPSLYQKLFFDKYYHE